MITIYDDETLAAARGDAALTTLIDRIAHDAKASDLWELTCIIVVEPADTGQELEGVLGFDPLVGPMGDGEWWDWLEHHPGYFELLHCVGDSGFAYFILVPNSEHNPLARLCRRHAVT